MINAGCCHTRGQRPLWAGEPRTAALRKPVYYRGEKFKPLINKPRESGRRFQLYSKQHVEGGFIVCLI